jgi:hypothetical protein
VKKKIQKTKAASEFNKIEKWRLIFLKAAAQIASFRQASSDAAPTTSMKRVGVMLSSPQTEKIRREKISTSFENIFSLSRSTTGSSFTEITLLRDMILEAIRIIHQFSKYPNGVPREVHSKILQTLREDCKIINMLNLNE